MKIRILAILLYGGLCLPFFLQAAEPNQPLRFRLLAGNLTSGNLQSYDPGDGSRILQGLQPDVAMLQEARFGNNTAAQFTGWIKAVFSDSFVFYREDKELPNAIVSRYPILSSGSWDDPEQVNREFAWAKIAITPEHTLLAVSVHLSAKKQEMRLSSAKALVEEISKNMTDKDWLVIAGDFNLQIRNEPVMEELKKVVVIAAPFPQDESGNENTNAKRVKPYDGVYVNPTLQQLAVPVSLGGSAGGLVFDSRVYKNLSLVPPVRKEDSDSTNMQHMAVVRDFLLP